MSYPYPQDEIQWFVQRFQESAKPHVSDKPLCYERKKLDVQDGYVNHDADADFEQRGTAVPHDERMPNEIISSNVDEDAERNKCISKHCCQKCRADNGVEFVAVHHMPQRGGGKPSGGKRHSGGNVDTNPQSPG